MNKLLVTTVEGRGFIDLTTIPAQTDVQGRAFVVLATDTVKRQISFGQLKTITDFPETAEDAGWAAFLLDHDGDEATAIENYRIHLTDAAAAADVSPKKKTKKA